MKVEIRFHPIFNANGKLISENIGYLATTGNKRGNFIFPIDLEKGVMS